ncbi:MAG: MarR family transcriptional regulator [Opitutaceae bacterium]|jgi:DNA-binding MarR family transcriptional regulator|nr:MarR family transcriptional regulator [Opitutaceae bacterium]
MPHLLLKDLPRYECLLECAQRFPQLDPSACEVFLHLLRAGDEGFRVIDAHFQAHNVSQGRFTVLMLLFEKNGGEPHVLTPAQLAEQAGVSRATMTGLIDTLERDGMVTRTPSPADRRMLSVTLTPRGQTFLESMLPEHFRRIGVLLDSLNESERRTLVRLLGKIANRAAEAFPTAAPGQA